MTPRSYERAQPSIETGKHSKIAEDFELEKGGTEQIVIRKPNARKVSESPKAKRVTEIRKKKRKKRN